MLTSASSSTGNLRNLSSTQVLSIIVCFFSTAYLILSFVYSLSINNTGGLPFQFWSGNVNKTPLINVLIGGNGNKNAINITILKNDSFICDYVKPANAHNTTSSSSFEHHRLNALRPYCDILPTPRNKWTPAQRYKESDIVFLIYTGASFYHGRATAIRDTWLSRVTHKYFFSSTPYPTLPVTIIEGAGEDYASNMKKLYIGMKLAFKEHNQTGKFYYLAGCDTFVNVPHILKSLNKFDYTKPAIIGGYPFGHSCYIKRKETVGITYPSGGAGFFLSARMMEMMYPKLTDFFENDWPNKEKPYSDVAINCLAFYLGVKPSFEPGFWAFSPEQTIKDHGLKKVHADPEPNTFHYVQPTSMYILDEFYVFQHIDRLANDGNLDELVKFSRQFVGVHYELIRIKNKECTLPSIATGKKP